MLLLLLFAPLLLPLVLLPFGECSASSLSLRNELDESDEEEGEADGRLTLEPGEPMGSSN